MHLSDPLLCETMSAQVDKVGHSVVAHLVAHTHVAVRLLHLVHFQTSRIATKNN